MQPINWPIEALNILPPIIFIALIIAFPLIGLAAGWKRAAFWGGGNLLFYIIGLIIWRFAGTAICTPLKDTIEQLIHSIPDAKSIVVILPMVVSLLAPVWYILFMAVSELILLINYYAWYKRIVGLKKIGIKDSKTGKMKKQHTKVSSPKAGTLGYKVGNRLGGVALMGVLTLPTSMAFAQATYYAMTSTLTRKNNQLSDNLYRGLQNITEGAFSWFTYYLTTGKDFDAVFSALALQQTKIEIEIEGATIEQPILTVVDEFIGDGINQIIDDDLGDIETTDGQKVLINDINTIAGYWNAIMANDDASDALTTVFNSENAVEMIEGILTIPTQTIDDSNFNALFQSDGESPSLFDSIVDAYVNNQEIGETGEKITPLTPIVVSEECVETISEFITNKLTFDFIGTDEQKSQKEQIAKEKFDSLINLFFITEADMPQPEPQQIMI